MLRTRILREEGERLRSGDVRTSEVTVAEREKRTHHDRTGNRSRTRTESTAMAAASVRCPFPNKVSAFIRPKQRRTRAEVWQSASVLGQARHGSDTDGGEAGDEEVVRT